MPGTGQRRPGLGVWIAALTLLMLPLQPLRAAELPLDPARFDTAGLQMAPDWPRLSQLYARSEVPLLWHSGDQANHTRIDALLTAIDDAVRQGLPAARYHDGLLNTGPDPLRRDLLLSDALIRLVDDLGDGMLEPGATDRLWHLSKPVLDPVASAWNLLQRDDLAAAVTALAPQTVQYRALVEQHRRLQGLVLSGSADLSPLPNDLLLKPDQQHAVVPLLRQRLEQLGDAQPDPLALQTAPDLYDQLLVQAVRGFQARHGLEVDGVVGPKTAAELNRPLSERLAQLRLNLERWRWLPRNLGERYILVSTAGYFLELVEQGQVVIETRTITGRAARPTPSFSSDLTQLTVNPSWTVPNRIMREDLLPQIRQDSRYLTEHNMKVLRYRDGGWHQVNPAGVNWWDTRGLMLRQSPGELNALGRIKFGMDNPFSIYLHDTPAQSLFEKPVRPFSSGCIRVEGIQSLVEYLLRDEPQMLEWLNTSLAQFETKVRQLPRRVPVYMVYLSAWVDTQGVAHFRPDIYGLDAALRSEWKSRETARSDGRQMAVN